MLTVNYLQRSLSKWIYATFILLIISAVGTIFSCQINRWLPDFTLSFSNAIAQQFRTKISFGTVHYRFPNTIILKNVKVMEYDEIDPMLKAAKVVLVFSFPLFSSATPLNSMVVDGMTIDSKTLKDYLTHQGKKVFAWANKFPKGKLHILIPDGRFQLNNHDNDEAIDFYVDLDLDQNRLNAHGSWGEKTKINYQLKGNIHNSGLDVERLTLDDGRSSMDLWGSWRNNNVNWKGYVFYDNFYILDIDGQLQVQKNDIVLNRLSFTVDGDAVGASGKCLRQRSFQCDADIAYWLQRQPSNALKALKNINLHLRAQNTPQGIIFNGWADLFFNPHPGPAMALQKLHLDFKNLKARIINSNFLVLKTDQIQTVLLIRGNEHKVNLENPMISLDFVKPYQRTITLSTTVFAGHCNSRIFLDTTNLPWQIKGQTSLENVDISLLRDSFSSFDQYQGLLSGSFDLRSADTTELSGMITVHRGNSSNTHFLAWMAKILQMHSLDHISGADLSCRFKVNEKSRMLDDIKLNTNDLDLNGFFHFDMDNYVSSQASVRFSKKLLGESPIGRKVMGLVRGAWTLPFEFSLSGNMYRMNFQWDNSPLKDKVRQHIFSFFERLIDRRMNAHPYYNEDFPQGPLFPDHNFTMQRESVSPG